MIAADLALVHGQSRKSGGKMFFASVISAPLAAISVSGRMDKVMQTAVV